MILSKKYKPIITPPVKVTTEIDNNQYQTEEEAFEGNGMADLYETVAAIIKDMPKDPKDPNGPKLFGTVAWNMGQLNHLRNKGFNDFSVVFPACLIHFINVYWNVGVNRINQAYADMRICVVLNRLNTADAAYQTEGVRTIQRIMTALGNNVKISGTLTNRFQPKYFDQVEIFDNGLQVYWLTYQVRFSDYSNYTKKNLVKAYLVAPPFTDFDDMKPEYNEDNHKNVDRPIEEGSGFTDSSQIVPEATPKPEEQPLT